LLLQAADRRGPVLRDGAALFLAAAVANLRALLTSSFPNKLGTEITQHFECVDARDLELAAQIRERHPALCLRSRYFVRDDDCVVGQGIRCQPTVGGARKIGTGGSGELRIVMHPIDQSTISISDGLGAGNSEPIVRRLCDPINQCGG